MLRLNERKNSNLLTALLATAAIGLLSFNASALDQNGNGPTRSAAVALYTFENGSGNVVPDQITSNGALDLTITGSSGTYSWSSAGLSLPSPVPVYIQSSGPATKIINACNASNAFTIEAWVIPQNPGEAFLEADGPIRMAALTNGVENAGGVYLGEGYNGGAFFDLGVHTSWSNPNGTYEEQGSQFTTDPSAASAIVRGNQPEHIIVTRDSSGQVNMYVSDQAGDPIPQLTATDKSGKLKLATNDFLTLGDDLMPGTDGTPTTYPTVQFSVNNGNVIEPISDKAFLGTIQMVAIYCTALTENQILGPLAPTDWLIKSAQYTSSGYNPSGTVVNSNVSITPQQQLASVIYQRVAGVTLPIDSETIQSMATVLAANPSDINARMQAAAIAENTPAFYNITVSDFAKPMSNIAGLTQVPLNDFVADVIGATRDGMDARQMLTGNYFYMADPTQTSVPSDLITSMITSNDHYSTLEKQDYDLSSVLTPVDSQNPKTMNNTTVNGQMIYKGDGQSVVPASQYGNNAVGQSVAVGGLLTTRQFASEALSAGTNRRAIRFAFNSFLCEDITQWGDANDPDNFVGRDVDRFPTGNHNVYTSTCRACHAPMDAMRPAFARFTFDPNVTAPFLKFSLALQADTTFSKNNGFTNPPPTGTQLIDQANDETSSSLMVMSGNTPVAGKYNKNTSVFPGGYPVPDDSWVNYTNRPGTVDRSYFGWNQNSVQADSSIAGQGVGAFAQMIAESQAYPRCLAQRVFQSVCKRAPDANSAADQQILTQAVNAFTSTDQYKIKLLFERIAVQPDCLGQ